MTETETWIAHYLQEHGRLDSQAAEEVLDQNYFDLEVLDSLAIIEFILAIEQAFGVRLESPQMQDPRFCTMRGLAEIIEEARPG